MLFLDLLSTLVTSSKISDDDEPLYPLPDSLAPKIPIIQIIQKDTLTGTFTDTLTPFKAFLDNTKNYESHNRQIEVRPYSHQPFNPHNFSEDIYSSSLIQNHNPLTDEKSINDQTVLKTMQIGTKEIGKDNPLSKSDERGAEELDRIFQDLMNLSTNIQDVPIPIPQENPLPAERPSSPSAQDLKDFLQKNYLIPAEKPTPPDLRNSGVNSDPIPAHHQTTRLTNSPALNLSKKIPKNARPEWTIKQIKVLISSREKNLWKKVLEEMQRVRNPVTINAIKKKYSQILNASQRQNIWTKEQIEVLMSSIKTHAKSFDHWEKVLGDVRRVRSSETMESMLLTYFRLNKSFSLPNSPVPSLPSSQNQPIEVLSALSDSHEKLPSSFEGGFIDDFTPTPSPMETTSESQNQQIQVSPYLHQPSNLHNFSEEISAFSSSPIQNDKTVLKTMQIGKKEIGKDNPLSKSDEDGSFSQDLKDILANIQDDLTPIPSFLSHEKSSTNMQDKPIPIPPQGNSSIQCHRERPSTPSFQKLENFLINIETDSAPPILSKEWTSRQIVVLISSRESNHLWREVLENMERVRKSVTVNSIRKKYAQILSNFQSQNTWTKEQTEVLISSVKTHTKKSSNHWKKVLKDIKIVRPSETLESIILAYFRLNKSFFLSPTIQKTSLPSSQNQPIKVLSTLSNSHEKLSSSLDVDLTPTPSPMETTSESQNQQIEVGPYLHQPSNLHNFSEEISAFSSSPIQNDKTVLKTMQIGKKEIGKDHPLSKSDEDGPFSQDLEDILANIQDDLTPIPSFLSHENLSTNMQDKPILPSSKKQPILPAFPDSHEKLSNSLDVFVIDDPTPTSKGSDVSDVEKNSSKKRKRGAKKSWTDEETKVLMDKVEFHKAAGHKEFWLDVLQAVKKVRPKASVESIIARYQVVKKKQKSQVVTKKQKSQVVTKKQKSQAKKQVEVSKPSSSDTWKQYQVVALRHSVKAHEHIKGKKFWRKILKDVQKVRKETTMESLKKKYEEINPEAWTDEQVQVLKSSAQSHVDERRRVIWKEVLKEVKEVRERATISQIKMKYYRIYPHLTKKMIPWTKPQKRALKLSVKFHTSGDEINWDEVLKNMSKLRPKTTKHALRIKYYSIKPISKEKDL